MTSRERMLAAMEGRPLDCIPVAPYFWGAEYSWKLTGKPVWEIVLGSRVGMELLESVDKRHGCDWVRHLHGGTGWIKGKKMLREDRSRVFFVDESSGEEWIFHKDGFWLGRAGEEKPAVEGAKQRDMPRTKEEVDEQYGPPGETDTSPIQPNTSLREHFPDRFLCGGMPAPFAFLAYTYGFEQTLLLLLDDPSFCAYFIERMTGDVERMAKQLAADGYDGALMCDSWASADIMSPQTYNRWIAPIHKRISDALHSVGLKSIIYNTGNVLPMLDTIVEMEYDAISIEERIKGVEMDIVEVRRQVGPDVCLFGNFDSYLLMDGDKDRIKSEVQRQMQAGKGSRFIMGTGSPICDTTDPDIVDYWISLVKEQSV